jgi:RNA polymerase sigma-70 factor, ECF subfamily
MKRKAKKSTCDRPKRVSIGKAIQGCLRSKKAKASQKMDATTLVLDSKTNRVNGEPGSAVAAWISGYRETGDPRAASWIFENYWHLVLGSCLKYLGDRDAAQDAAMDILHKILEKLRTETPTYFPAWLYTVTRNHCVEILRKGNKSPDFESLEKVKVAMEPEASFVEHQENQSILAAHVQKALAELPEHQRECVEMFYMQELSYKEISEESGYSLKKVKSFIQNGKRKLTLLLSAFRGRHLSDLSLR